MRLKKQEPSEYDIQARDFLKATGTTFKADFIGSGLYFGGDTDKRDIYQITLTRFCIGNGPEDRFYSFRFGQSIKASGFTSGHGTHKDFAKPTAYDVLACIQKYDVGDFENFCAEFGYDTDSRQAEKTYNAVREEFKNVERLYNAEEIEQLQEIQ